MKDGKIVFEIKLAKIGMRYGGYMAVSAALLALGGEELIRLNLLSGGILLASGFTTALVCTLATRKETQKLETDNTIQTKNTIQEKVSSNRDSMYFGAPSDISHH